MEAETASEHSPKQATESEGTSTSHTTLENQTDAVPADTLPVAVPPVSTSPSDESPVRTRLNEKSKPENLISETCQERFDGPEFEFSVSVDSKLGEAIDNGDREIIVSKNSSEEKSDSEVLADSTQGTQLSPEHQTEGPDNVSSEGCDRSEASVISVVRQVSIDHETESTHVISEHADEPKKEDIDEDDIHVQGGPSVHTQQELEINQPGPIVLEPASVSPVIADNVMHAAVVEETWPQESEETQPQAADASSVQQLNVSAEVVSKVPQLSDSEIAHVDTTQKAVAEQGDKKKKSRFNFKIKRAKSHRERESTKIRHDHSDTGSEKSFGRSVRNAFGSLTRSIKARARRNTPERATKPTARPPRPPPIDKPSEELPRKIRLNASEFDQQSLESISGPSLSNSPDLSRKRVIRKALPDFIEAMPINEQPPLVMNGEAHLMYPQRPPEPSPHDGQTCEVQPQTDQNEKDQVLAWTAGQIASSSRPNEIRIGLSNSLVAKEEMIQPVHIQRQILLGQLTTGLEGSDQKENSLAQKPPRPVSPPALSPLDYQPFHQHPQDEGFSHPDLGRKRMDMLQSITPPASGGGNGSRADSPSLSVRYRIEPQQVVTATPSRTIRPVTTSLDRREPTEYSSSSPTSVRRANTLRTDYADRVRERVKSLRVEPVEGSSPDGTIRPRKTFQKQQTYVCSETIKWPKIPFKLKRRQTDAPPKNVYSTPNETIVPRPQPKIMSGYYANNTARPPVPPSVIVSERVTLSHSGHLQSAIPTTAYTGMSAHRPDLGTGRPLSESANRQLTSLRSVEAHNTLLQQSTYINESPKRGLFHMAQADGPLSKQLDVTAKLPYFSDELGLCSTGGMPKIINADEQTATEIAEEEKTKINEALKKTQPFLEAWNTSDSETDPDMKLTTVSKEITKECIQDFLNTCVRLRSVDLQGQFAPFHYPLSTFDRRLWKTCGRLENWCNLLILREPEWNTEYVQLSPSATPGQTVLYSTRTIDSLLTNWLDCHHTSPRTSVTAAAQISNTVYHPILLISDLKHLLESQPYTVEGKNTLMHTCLRLAVLLTYENCLVRMQNSLSLSFNLNPEKILIALSTNNCLVVFQACAQETTHTPSSPTKLGGSGSDVDQPDLKEVDQLVEYLCAEYKSLDKAIDGMIEKVHQIATVQLGSMGMLPGLLKAIAPPDWIAMITSRISMKML
ncbi:hypothetical protein EG68_02629 [Paragonimus skrjabini miyazakii]|uniref:Uncharacterized protein n=1 Tax=Paragonimus skrjabini miyazakii TaxID=59628 RepID=A0A8S9Z2R9_9TREM|nr:hypothetical protein EG68_02629 [Paragonimus skrjabini miyazakii]